jgi:hypothetical protein
MSHTYGHEAACLDSLLQQSVWLGTCIVCAACMQLRQMHHAGSLAAAADNSV